MKNLEEQLDKEIKNWDGMERRLACQGCSTVYAKLLRSEKFNLDNHKELFRLNYQKASKRSFYLLIVVVLFALLMSFKFRSDFELRYIKNLEDSNKSLQEVIYSLNDLVNDIDSINSKINFSEDDLDKKILSIQKDIEKTQKVLRELQNKVNSKRSKK